MKNSGIFWLIGLIVVIAIISTLLLIEPYELKGSEINPPTAAPNFSLASAQGKNYVLSEHKGKIVLIFFGYTFCPDICPITLHKIKSVKEALGDLSQDVEVVFITVDPERDTQNQIGAYLEAFDDTFFGLTGTVDDLAPVWKDYGIFQQKREVPGSTAYLVDHSTRIFLVDRNGNLKVTYLVDVSNKDLAADIRHIFKSGD